MLKKIVIDIRVAQPSDRGAEGILTKKVALMGAHASHFVKGRHQRGASHFPILIDDNVQRQTAFPTVIPVAIVAEEAPGGASKRLRKRSAI